MKLYTSSAQTAKLIELGFEKPKNEVKAEQAGDYAWYNPAYSIGELLSFCPKYIGGKSATIDISFDMFNWVVAYFNVSQEYVYCTISLELADALYDMILRLKEEEVI